MFVIVGQTSGKLLEMIIRVLIVIVNTILVDDQFLYDGREIAPKASISIKNET